MSVEKMGADFGRKRIFYYHSWILAWADQQGDKYTKTQLKITNKLTNNFKNISYPQRLSQKIISNYCQKGHFIRISLIII